MASAPPAMGSEGLAVNRYEPETISIAISEDYHESAISGKDNVVDQAGFADETGDGQQGGGFQGVQRLQCFRIAEQDIIDCVAMGFKDLTDFGGQVLR